MSCGNIALVAVAEVDKTLPCNHHGHGQLQSPGMQPVSDCNVCQTKQHPVDRLKELLWLPTAPPHAFLPGH
jgi:hypothetical protein